MRLSSRDDFAPHGDLDPWMRPPAGGLSATGVPSDTPNLRFAVAGHDRGERGGDQGDQPLIAAEDGPQAPTTSGRRRRTVMLPLWTPVA
jgi:hypothetical protein